MKTVVKSKTPSQILTGAKSEMSFQKGIDRMQLAIVDGENTLNKAVQRANDELDKIKERENKLNAKGLKAESDYSTLKAIYEKELVHLTSDVLTAQAAIDAAKFMKRAQGKVTNAQEKIVIDYYYLSAKKNLQVIESVRGLLVFKKLLKEPAKTEAKKGVKTPVIIEG